MQYIGKGKIYCFEELQNSSRNRKKEEEIRKIQRNKKREKRELKEREVLRAN